MTVEEYQAVLEKVKQLREVVEDRRLQRDMRLDALTQLEEEGKRLHKIIKGEVLLSIRKAMTLRKINRVIKIPESVYRELGLGGEYARRAEELKAMKKGTTYYLQYKILLISLAIMVLMWVGIGAVRRYQESEKENNYSYQEFMGAVEAGEIEEIIRGVNTYQVYYKEGEGLEGLSEERIKKIEKGEWVRYGERDTRRRESIFQVSDPTFERDMLEQGVEVKIMEVNTFILVTAVIMQLALYLFVYAILIYLLYKYILEPMTMRNTKLGKTDIDHITTTMDDVAGMTEEKLEIEAAVESMRASDKYIEMGIKPIKGILLEGPPGTGKTLLAKAVAGEMGLPFLSYSGSEFVEMYVGLGAKRIRDLFVEARKQAPCVVFIDEIDAFCGKRGVHGGAGGQEVEGTMLELLNQLDGMEDNRGIFMMAATNRSDSLDPAIMRPGRFDKVIHIGLPSKREDREGIVRVHIRDKKLAKSLTVEEIGKLCYGLSGAEIATVMNDAALDSYRDGRDGEISKKDIESATMKLYARGLAKGKHSTEDLRRVAVHELGHALMNEKVGREVIKVSVQPYSSGVGGVTVVDGESSKLEGLRTRQDLEDDIKVLYAGKVAEEVFLGDCSVGASNDLERVTDTLVTYVGMVGMGEHNMSYNRLSELGLKDVGGEILQEMQEVATRLYKEVEDYIKEYQTDAEKKARFEELLERIEEEGTIYKL